jgi:hypothetical protein
MHIAAPHLAAFSKISPRAKSEHLSIAAMAAKQHFRAGGFSRRVFPLSIFNETCH